MGTTSGVSAGICRMCGLCGLWTVQFVDFVDRVDRTGERDIQFDVRASRTKSLPRSEAEASVSYRTNHNHCHGLARWISGSVASLFCRDPSLILSFIRSTDGSVGGAWTRAAGAAEDEMRRRETARTLCSCRCSPPRSSSRDPLPSHKQEHLLINQQRREPPSVSRERTHSATRRIQHVGRVQVVDRGARPSLSAVCPLPRLESHQ